MEKLLRALDDDANAFGALMEAVMQDNHDHERGPRQAAARSPASGPSLPFGDARLARRAAGGDERAFAAIYRRHHQELYRYCRAILRDPDDAQDALQATMVKALRALPGEPRTIA